jgi:hypothetical protein
MTWLVTRARVRGSKLDLPGRLSPSLQVKTRLATSLAPVFAPKIRPTTSLARVSRPDGTGLHVTFRDFACWETLDGGS